LPQQAKHVKIHLWKNQEIFLSADSVDACLASQVPVQSIQRVLWQDCSDELSQLWPGKATTNEETTGLQETSSLQEVIAW
jgi:hypothetical protein